MNEMTLRDRFVGSFVESSKSFDKVEYSSSKERGVIKGRPFFVDDKAALLGCNRGP